MILIKSFSIFSMKLIKPVDRASRSALNIGISFIIGGIVPLIGVLAAGAAFTIARMIA